jgi:hypothetical protein
MGKNCKKLGSTDCIEWDLELVTKWLRALNMFTEKHC